MTTFITIRGTDGAVVRQDTSGVWKEWEISQIFTGVEGNNKFIPKTGDGVINYPTQERYIVTKVNPDGTSEMLPVTPQRIGVFQDRDVLLGGRHRSNEDFILYFNPDILPFRLTVDAFCWIPGSEVSYGKLFLGSDITESGTVVSRRYQADGSLIDDRIPLALASVDGQTNYTIKTIPSFQTQRYINDREVCTMVFYNDKGGVCSYRQMLIVHTNLISDTNNRQRMIRTVYLESPYLPYGTNVLEIPLNTTINSVNLTGVVEYTDGEIERELIGGRFQFLGLNNLITSSLIKKEAVLSYRLQDGEEPEGSVVCRNNAITVPYAIKIVEPNEAYNVRLFVYPVWVDKATGYKLTWWMLTGDRQRIYNVTNLVMFHSSTGVFDPKAYGYLQRKQVSVNLSQVDNKYKNYTHVQLVEVTLLQTPVAGLNPWVVNNEPNNNLQVKDVLAKKVNGKISIKNNSIDINDWLSLIYKSTSPIVNGNYEVPLPNTLIISYMNEEYELAISYWNKVLTFSNPLVNNKNIVIKFVYKTANFINYLGVVELPITD